MYAQTFICRQIGGAVYHRRFGTADHHEKSMWNREKVIVVGPAYLEPLSKKTDSREIGNSRIGTSRRSTSSQPPASLLAWPATMRIEAFCTFLVAVSTRQMYWMNCDLCV